MSEGRAPGSSAKRKCVEGCEDAPTSKQPRTASPATDVLSEGNLELFNGAIGNATKRSRSEQTSTTQETKTTCSLTNARYRFEVLEPALLKLHVDPPAHIQEAIHAIVNVDPPEGRRDKIISIAKEFRSRCTEQARKSVGENDFVRMFHQMLDLMGFNKLCLNTNAEWDSLLRPKIHHSRLNLPCLKGGGQQQRVGDPLSSSPTNQQQNIGQHGVSTQPSMTNRPPESDKMPPPSVSAPVAEIKTPRPDITIGISLDVLLFALSSPDVDEVETRLFLASLQQELELGEPGGPREPALISVPAKNASNLAFPFGVVEGKAYLTGQQIAGAENQAAVAGACALKIQLRLDELVKRSTSIDPLLPTPSDDPPQLLSPKLAPSSDDQIPFFFSISTEGPIHVLWAHWTEFANGRRKYNMVALKSVYGVLQDGLVDFFIMVDNVLRWGTGHFLESLVVRLRKVAGKAEPEPEV